MKQPKCHNETCKKQQIKESNYCYSHSEEFLKKIAPEHLKRFYKRNGRQEGGNTSEPIRNISEDDWRKDDR